MTDPSKKLLQSDLAKANARELIDVACPLIEELRNYATQVYVRCASAGVRHESDLPVFFLFHHVIEMSDGVHVLLSESSCGPGLPVLRSLFEAFLPLEYIMAAETEKIYSRRLRSWDYVETIKDIKKYKSYDPKHQQSKALRKLVTETMSQSGQAPDFSKAIQKREEFLQSEDMRDIAVEYERTSKKGNRRRRECEWYELFDGPLGRCLRP